MGLRYAFLGHTEEGPEVTMTAASQRVVMLVEAIAPPTVVGHITEIEAGVGVSCSWPSHDLSKD